MRALKRRSVWSYKSKNLFLHLEFLVLVRFGNDIYLCPGDIP
jgi:hypothetical protein